MSNAQEEGLMAVLQCWKLLVHSHHMHQMRGRLFSLYLYATECGAEVSSPSHSGLFLKGDLGAVAVGYRQSVKELISFLLEQEGAERDGNRKCLLVYGLHICP